MANLLDKAEDKEMIATLTQINDTINNIEADTTALERDNRSLLNDYKEMVKHTSFKVDKAPERVELRDKPKFEDFLQKQN